MGNARAKILEEDGCLVRVVHLDRVEKARQEVISERELERLALIYKVLGDRMKSEIHALSMKTLTPGEL